MFMFSWATVYVLDSINAFLSLHGGRSHSPIDLKLWAQLQKASTYRIKI